MYTADLQVHIKSTGYSESILMKVEKNLIWIGVSRDVFPLMQKKLSTLKKKIRKGQCGSVWLESCEQEGKYVI